MKKKLQERYGSEWWSKGISQKQREDTDSKKADESAAGWKVSSVTSDMEYLQFSDLSKVITTQWDVFKDIFKDQSKIQHRLNELEIIRNSIAHTRTLSLDAITRLQQYNSDILTLIQ